MQTGEEDMTEPIDMAAVLVQCTETRDKYGAELRLGSSTTPEWELWSDLDRAVNALAETQRWLEALTASAETWRADIEEASSKPGDLLTLAREMALALEVREEAIADWKSHSEETQRQMENIASDALWHDGGPNPEALDEIRDLLRSLGYSRKWAHDRAERQDAQEVLSAQATFRLSPELEPGTSTVSLGAGPSPAPYSFAQAVVAAA